MENYRIGIDEGNDLGSIDFDMLVRNLEVCPALNLFILAEVEYILTWLNHVKLLHYASRNHANS